MKKTMTSLLLSLLLVFAYCQDNQQNTIERLIHTPGTMLEITTEQSHGIRDNKEVLVKKYEDLMNNKIYYSIEMYDCIFDQEEYNELLMFFKKSVEYSLNPVHKKEIVLQYNSTGGARISFVKSGGQSSVIFRHKEKPGFLAMMLAKDVEKVYSILTKLEF